MSIIDAYGSLQDVTVDGSGMDVESLESAVTGLLIEHPLCFGDSNIFIGSSVGAKLVEILDVCVYGDSVHPKSEVALRMAAIVRGISDAVIERLAETYGWDEVEEQRAINALASRLRNRKCKGISTIESCDNRTGSARAWFCAGCQAKLDADHL